MPFNQRKSAQVLAYYLLANGKQPMNRVKAMKLVFLADRESLKLTGAPMLDERRYSMRRGPINSSTLSMINGEHPDTDVYDSFITDSRHHTLTLVNDALTEDDLDELSDADIEALQLVWRRCGAMGTWGNGGIVEYTHDCDNVPEWRDPGSGRLPIALLEMAQNLGIENAEEVVADYESAMGAERVLRAL